MKTSKKIKDSALASHESRNDQQNNDTSEAPVGDSGSISATSNDSKKVSRQDIEFVQNLIERCLQLYMNSDEVVKTLLTRARIDPGFTTLVWRKLEEENADFFRAYYIRLKLKKQILLFNHLLEHQYHLMKYPIHHKVPMAPMQNEIHLMPVNNLPMGYPVLQHHPIPIPIPGQPHLETVGGGGMSNCHIVNGVPAPSNFHPIRMNSGNDMVMDTNAAQAEGQVNGVMSAMSEMPMSPASVASSGHFPFTASELSGMGISSSALETGFPSDGVNSEGLQLVPDGGSGISRDSLRPLDQIQWKFSFSDLTADLSNLAGDFGIYFSHYIIAFEKKSSSVYPYDDHARPGSCFSQPDRDQCLILKRRDKVVNIALTVVVHSADLGALGNYTGSPFLPSDSEILLDSPEQDGLVEEFFVDSVPGQPFSQSDEEKS